jgi:hypothetical protein
MPVDVHAEDPDRAARRAGHPVDHAQGRCLSRSIGSQKSETSLRWDLQVQVIHNQPLAESLRNGFRDDDILRL